jgi:RNA polymerase sigma-70 factor (ECF subfamily)
VPLRNAYDALPEAELRDAVLAGEPAAWPTFFARYERLILSCIRRALHRYHAHYNDEDVEDLVSQTALNLVKDDYKKLRAFDATRGYKLSSWVGLIATNTALDALRRRTPGDVAQAASLDDEAQAIDPPSESEGAEAALERAERRAELGRAVAELTPSDRLFVEYYFASELPPEEIARLMNISLNTVYSRKNKIREKLKRILGGAGGKDDRAPA